MVQYDGMSRDQLVYEITALRKRISALEKLEIEHQRVVQALRESEDKFRGLVERSNVSVYLIQDGVFRYSNACFAEMLGYTVEEIVDKITPEDVVFPEDYQSFSAENIRKRLTGEVESLRYEVRLVTKDGKTRYAEAHGSRTTYQGRPAVIGTIVDITDREHAEAALHKSEQQYRAVFENTGAATVIIEQDTTISLCNAEFERLSGYTRNEIEGKKSWTEFVFKEDLERMVAQHRMRRENHDQALQSYEFRFVTKSAEMRNIYLVIDTIRGTQKSVASLLDITERIHAEEATNHVYRRLDEIIEFLPDATFVIDADGTVIAWNNAIEQMTGVSKEDMIGKGNYEYAIPFYGERRLLLIDLVLLSDEDFERNHYKDVHRQGDILYAEAYVPQTYKGKGASLWGTSSKLRDAHRNTIGAIESIRDITDRKLAEDALRRSEQILHAEKDKLQTICENVPLGIALIDKNGAFTYLNPTFKEMFGYDLNEIPDGRTWFRKIYPDESYRHSVISAWIEDFSSLKPGEKKKRTYAVTCKNNAQKIINFIPLVLLSGDYLMTCEDVTELKNLESRLLQSQKMEAIGTLAGGVAHDFNNILTAIMGYGSLLQMDMDDDDGRRQYVDQILASSEKAAHLTQSLLAFSRKQTIELKPRSVNAIIDGITKLLKRLLTEDIELKVVLIDREIVIMCDMGQIDQVLINLAANARDAMPDGGRLVITTKEVRLDDEFIHTHGFGKPGSYALISVTDTGCGIDEMTKEKIFEPFFTTKEMGKGTGLGLSIVYGIIKQHNGYINVYSEAGKGTVFNIYLPVTRETAEEVAQRSVEVKNGTETILVAEDNNEARGFIREVLTRKGYTVIEAIDGEDAVWRFTENKDTVDLLILDVVMPRKNGKEAYEEIRKARPDVKVLFASGYTGDVVFGKGIKDEAYDFITKPVSPNELLSKVREVLDK